MEGNLLIPLNKLSKTQPKLYDQYIQKYEGREKLLLKSLPILKCLWNDVIHLSPINPQLIIDVWKKEGLVADLDKREPFEVYKIPIQKLSKKKTIYFQSLNFDYDHFDPRLNKYSRYIEESYRELSSVPKEQIQVWKDDKSCGRVLFWYSHILHVLTQDNIDISNCEIITCQ
jgi:hypothetical protein